MTKLANMMLVTAVLFSITSVSLRGRTVANANLAGIVGGLCDNDDCENQTVTADECQHTLMGPPIDPSYDRCSKTECVWTVAVFGQCADGAVGGCECALVTDSGVVAFSQWVYVGDYFSQCGGYYNDYISDPWQFTIYPAMDCNPLGCDPITGRCSMGEGQCSGILVGDPIVRYGASVCPSS